MHNSSDDTAGPSVVSNRTMEVVTALLFLVGSAIVIYGTQQIGVGWRDDGPAPGFFPFCVAVLMAVASAVNLIAALRMEGGDSFVARNQLGRVLAVLVPSILYVAVIGGIDMGPIKLPGLGIYVASFLFISGFMLTIGREPLWKSASVALLVPLVAFMMFEKWFQVALPKGPLEALLGLA